MKRDGQGGAHAGVDRALDVVSQLGMAARAARLHHFGADALVEAEELLLLPSVRRAVVGADDEAAGRVVAEAQDHVVALEDHRDRTGSEPDHLVRLGFSQELDRELVHGADAGRARGEPGFAGGVAHLRGGRVRDLRQRAFGLGAEPVGMLAGLDGEQADESVPGNEGQGGVGHGAAFAVQEGGGAVARRAAVDAVADLHPVLAAEAAAGEGGRLEAKGRLFAVVEVEGDDAAAHAAGEAAAQAGEPFVEGRGAIPEDRVQIVQRVVAAGAIPRALMFACPDDQRAGERGELLDEAQVGFGQGGRIAVMREVQDAERFASVAEGHGECGFDVRAFAHELKGARIGAARNANRRAVRGHASRDAVAQRHADLAPELTLDADGHTHAQVARLGVDQHHRAGVRARGTDRHVEDAFRHGVGVVGEFVGVDDLAQRFEQLGLALGFAACDAPEQAGGERGQDAHVAPGALRGAAAVRIDHRVQAGGGSEHVRVVAQQLAEGFRAGRVDLRPARAGGGRIRIVDGHEFEVRVSLEHRNQPERLLTGAVDGDAFAHANSRSGPMPRAGGGADPRGPSSRADTRTPVSAVGREGRDGLRGPFARSAAGARRACVRAAAGLPLRRAGGRRVPA